MSTFSRGVTAVCAVLALSGAASAQDKKKDVKAESTLAAEFSPVYAVVDRSMSGTGGVSTDYGMATYLVTPSATEPPKTDPAPADSGYVFEVRHDFLKGQQGKIYIPFSVLVDKTKVATPRLALVSRLAPKGATGPEAPAAAPAAATAKENKDKKSKDKKAAEAAPAPPRYLWDDALEMDLPAVGQAATTYRGVGALSVEPGTYDLYIAFRERSAADAAAGGPIKVTVLKKEITVPDLTEFSTSSIILTDKVEVLNEPLSPERQRENPYTLGVLKLLPSVDNRFVKAGELNMFFWIYGVALDAAKKPHVEVEYNFHQKTADGEKFFNKTDPQIMNAETLPPTFDLNAGHQLTGSLAVPLASFPEGQYRLELKIGDKISGKTITRESTFSVVAQ
jgi:hypothetical protein